jgi:hypothetical protein
MPTNVRPCDYLLDAPNRLDQPYAGDKLRVTQNLAEARRAVKRGLTDLKLPNGGCKTRRPVSEKMH